jgi:hypothetical protein
MARQPRTVRRKRLANGVAENGGSLQNQWKLLYTIMYRISIALPVKLGAMSSLVKKAVNALGRLPALAILYLKESSYQ